MDIPKCCGQDMKVIAETPQFVEVWCEQCEDRIYVKKAVEPPQMIDD